MIEKKNIIVVTATRAEYGLLKPVIERLLGNSMFDVKIVATGSHLSPEFGLTYQDIEKDGFQIDEKIPIVLGSDTPSGISKSMGLAMIGFGDYFERSKPDLVVLLGDRYETLAIACAAQNAGIPIAHLYGGETTEGAVDEAYRHSITKMSWLHFTSTEAYRKRVIQLGENPVRVFSVGAIGVENAVHMKLMQKEDLSKSLGFLLDKPYAVVTFHPVTLEKYDSVEGQIEDLLRVMGEHSELKYIITGANADAGGRIINHRAREFSDLHDNAVYVPSLGKERYLSALRYAKLVIGNSSSGIVEAPSFGIPTINIGDRQKGRIQAESVVNCKAAYQDISAAFDKACSADMQKKASKAKNPYGDGDSSAQIAKLISDALSKPINLKKVFYDIDIQVQEFRL